MIKWRCLMCGEKDMNYSGQFYPYANDFCSYAEQKEIEGEQGMSYYIASLSCGNDSMAMVYELIRRGYPLDEIVFIQMVWISKQYIVCGSKSR